MTLENDQLIFRGLDIFKNRYLDSGLFENIFFDLDNG